MNLVMAEEYFISIFYFAGLTGSFIPIAQPRLNLSKAFSKFRSTSWDLFMLRIPPMHLMADYDGYTELDFICTADKAFSKLASQCVVAGITRIPHDPEIESPRFF